MGDGSVVEKMQGKINPESVKKNFDMTTNETAYYACKPTMLAFSAKYILCVMILVVHLFFWWSDGADLGDDTNGFIQLLVSVAGWLGIAGFVFIMLIVTWFNRFMNWSSSGGWYTTSMLIITITPGIFVIEDVIVTVSGWFGAEYAGLLPSWDNFWFLILGFGYFAIMLCLTIWYNRSFNYAISDRTIYLKKDFMLNHTLHNIPLADINNLKLDVPWYGRILGFGTVNMLTASGFGVLQESISVSSGGTMDTAISDQAGFLRKMLKLFFVVISLQRTRQDMDTSEPEDCLYGVAKPKEVYKLVNELQVQRVDHIHTTNVADDEPAAETSQAEEVASEETLSDLVD